MMSTQEGKSGISMAGRGPATGGPGSRRCFTSRNDSDVEPKRSLFALSAGDGIEQAWAALESSLKLPAADIKLGSYCTREMCNGPSLTGPLSGLLTLDSRRACFRSRARMAPEPVEHKLAAILSADAVGYSRLMAASSPGP